jgi:tripartite-type tricarboxylate transporter receptor subunit TctC
MLTSSRCSNVFTFLPSAQTKLRLIMTTFANQSIYQTHARAILPRIVRWMSLGATWITLAYCLAALVLPSWASAQAFPSRPIRLVVPYPAGGPLDVAARALAEAARPQLGTVIVDNKAGAGGNVGADSVAKAAPDGHTLLLGAVATHAINPSLFPKMPYDAVRDFAPLTLVANVPNVLVLNRAFAEQHGIATVAQLVRHLQAHPGRTQFASGGNGSAGHLAGELFKMRTQTFSLHIPYRGAGPAQMALLSGEVHFMFDNLASAAPAIREGKVVALGVTTTQASAQMPSLAPLAQSGVAALKDFDISTWFGLFAPAGTPQTVLERLHADFTVALRTPAVATVLARMAAEPSPTTPQDLAKLVASDTIKYRAIVKHSGAKVD